MKKHVILFVEGHTDIVLFPKIIQHYKDLTGCTDIVFHIENLKGVGNYKGKAKGKVKQHLQDINEEGDVLIRILCSYDTDRFEFDRNPPIDWKKLSKELNTVVGKNVVRMIPVEHSIEDWLLSDIDGLCSYLKTKKKPHLVGGSGFDKLCNWFKQYGKVYSKGYDCQKIVPFLNVKKIASTYSKALTPLKEVFGIKQ